MDRDPDGGSEDGKVGQGEDLTGLLPHLGLLGRVSVVAHAPDHGYGVPDYGPGERILPTVLQSLDATASRARDGLIRGDNYLLQAEPARERRERDDHLDG